jgi:prevent-host-death family protein
MPLGEFCDHVSEIVHEVATTHERVTITSDGRPTVILMAVDDLEGLEETLDILRTPGALEEIRQAEEELSRGEGIDAQEVTEILRRRQAAEEETLDLIRTPGAVDEIRKASTEFERGDYVSALELLDRYRTGKK